MSRTYTIAVTHDGHGFHIVTNGFDNGTFYNRKEAHQFFDEALDELDGTDEEDADEQAERHMEEHPEDYVDQSGGRDV